MLKLFKFICLFSYFFSLCLCIDEVINTKVNPMKSFMFWPNATVPFFINPDHFDHEQMMAIMTSLSMFAFKTCLKFAPVMAAPDENQHVMAFVNPDGIRRCKIEIRGHSNFYPHLVLLGYECLQSPEIDMIIMRTLGFPFEHNRMSRDVYIDVMIENIEPSSIGLFTKDNVLPPALRVLPYDINSVMHFGERDYSKNGHRTIIFKNSNIRQNRLGLSAMDLRKIELVYGPECRKRDRQEKIELCQSYPGVARRKREIFEPPANKSLRVNPDITPPPSLLMMETEKPTTDPAPTLEEDAPEIGYITDGLQALGIGTEADEIVEQVYKVTGLALKNAHAKYCNASNSSIAKYEKPNVRRSNATDLIAILEVITDYSSTVVHNALKNLTVFCKTSSSIESYQRQCNFAKNPRCHREYRSTKTGNVRYSTKHRPVIKQPTAHEGSKKRYVYDKNRRADTETSDETTPSLAPSRRKREATMPTATPKPPEAEELKEKKVQKEKKILKEKEKEKEKIVRKELKEKNNLTKTVTLDASTTKAKVLKESRRFFKERRYKVKNPENLSEGDLDVSHTSLDKEKELQIENIKREQREKEIVAQRELHRVKEKAKAIELVADKLFDNEEIIKDVLGEGLDQLKDKISESNNQASSKSVDEENEEDSEVETEEASEVEKEEGEGKKIKIHKAILPEKELELETSKSIEPEVEKQIEPQIKKQIEPQEQLGLEKSIEIENTAETTDVEPVTEKKKDNSKDRDILNLEAQNSKEKEVMLLKQAKVNMNEMKRSKGSAPKTVRLTRLNKEFYNERLWPDGIVRFVIKQLREYDLEDLRNRLAEVNSILIRETCVRLHEVDTQEADGYDDSIILDTSPDYVTGKVGGKQIFGCVELFRGGQHRQHTAMMVMAMLGFYFEVSRHDRDKHIRVHMRHVRPDKLHHFEKIRDEATFDLPYDYKSATHPAWQFWRKIGKTGISTVATYKEQDPDGSVMRSLGQNERLLSDLDIIKINSIYGVKCFENKRTFKKKKPKRHRAPDVSE